MNFKHSYHVPSVTIFKNQMEKKGGDLHMGSTNLIIGTSNRSSAVKTGQQVPQMLTANPISNLKLLQPIIKTGGTIKQNKRNNIRIVF